MIRPEDIRPVQDAPAAAGGAAGMAAGAETGSTPPPPAPERLHALDACRAVAMLLGLYLHAALPFREQAAQTWAFADPAPSAWMDLSVEVIHAFRMQVFFLLAGFFAALLIDRRGWRGLVKNRAVRIGVPYLFGIVLIAPVCTAVWVWAEGEWEFLTLGVLAGAVGESWHLWFLRELLIFCAAAAGVAALVPRRALARVGGWVGGVALHPLGPLAVAGVVMATLLAQPWWGIHGPGVLPRWENLVHYGVFFALGAAMWPHRGRIAVLGRWWAVWGAAGAVAAAAHFAVRGWFHGMGDEDFAWIGAEPTGAALAARATHALMTAFLVYAFIGVFVRGFPGVSVFWRFVADASYWVYLVHFPLVVGLGFLVTPLPWPGIVKVGLVLAVSGAVLFGSYALLVRGTLVGRVLNGPGRARATRRAA